mgnify:CR=1 FL=1
MPPDAVVFEWDSAKFKSKSNPGVGPTLGNVKDAAVGKGDKLEVLWADSVDTEVMARSECRATTDVGESFHLNGKLYTLVALNEQGVTAAVVADKSPKKKRTARKSQNVKAKTRKSEAASEN